MQLSSFPHFTPISAPRLRIRLRCPLFLQILNIFPDCRQHQHQYRLSCITAQLSSSPSPGVTRFSSANVDTTQAQENVDSKANHTVFVAGATGKVGSRTVRELLKMGFHVRAGVRSAQRAETLIQSVRQMKLPTEDATGVKPIEKLEIVECDLEQRDQIIPALGCASVVMCCIGASEKEIFDVTGPFRIDYQATKNLINAARAVKAEHFILLTSLGTNKIGFPAAILNLFWGVLIWKRKAEEELIASGVPYTIVRPGGMERPTDTYKETHNITLSQEDTLFGGQVSNLQVAELMAVIAQNRDLSYCKIVEVVAETTAALTPMEDLLVKIPSKRKDMSKAKRPEEPAKSSIYKAVEETVQVKNIVAKPYPLSPYTAYDDLKPPSSPTPTAPNAQRKGIATTETPESPPILPGTGDTTESVALKPRPLSPYTAYEDLKPPSSPTPSPPTNSLDEPVKAPTIVDGKPQVIAGTLPDNDPREFTFYNSPFPVYDELRPPTSPTPKAPNSAAKVVSLGETSSMSTENGAEPSISTEAVTTQNTEDEQFQAVAKPRPLSPYTMYDELKPPSSPTPSPKRN